jgi:hypothetical protein
MELTATLVSILIDKSPEYLKYSYNDVKPYLTKSSSIAEVLKLPGVAPESFAQIELNPLYEHAEGAELEIVCTLLISNGRYEFTRSVYYPINRPAYCDDEIFDASGPGLPILLSSPCRAE